MHFDVAKGEGAKAIWMIKLIVEWNRGDRYLARSLWIELFAQSKRKMNLLGVPQNRWGIVSESL